MPISYRKPTKQLTLSETELFDLALTSEILGAADDGLAFLHTFDGTDGVVTTQTLSLKGAWQLSSDNQLQFRVKCNERKLSFRGSWKITRTNELIYTASRESRSLGAYYFQCITFRGGWNFRDDLELSYSLQGSGDVLNFTGRITKLETRAGRARIRYALGASLDHRLSGKRTDTLTLFGLWRPVSKTELGFEIKLREGAACLLKLKGAYSFSKKTSVEFALTEKFDSRAPRLSVTLSRRILKGKGEIFLRGETDLKDDHFVGVGARLKW